MLSFSRIKKIHFVGIGGIGVSALAKMMLLADKEVSGSDLNMSDITDDLKKLGASIFKGHRKSNLPPAADLIIYSSAASKDNPERQEAFNKGVPQLSYFEALGLLSKGKFTIAVSGTNGKTTVTAMTGLILERAGLDPTVVVGSKVKEFGGFAGQQASNFRQGKSGYFVVEACEYQAHMLELNPQIIILTNIEEDHLDYYRNLRHIQSTFQTYIDKLPQNGVLILNVDDPVSRKFKLPKCRVITYGIRNKAEITAKNVKVENGYQKFDVHFGKAAAPRTLNFLLRLPGRFNVYNALAAIAGSLNLGIRPEVGRDVLTDFSGIWRRFEKVGVIPIHGSSVTDYPAVISDYAHHPTAIQGTIQGAKDFYPGKRLVVVFQPHQRNRTRKLFSDFVRSFSGADLLIVSEIYDVAGRENKEDKNISSKDLVQTIKKRFNSNNIFFTRDLPQTKSLIFKKVRPNDLILIMGAGDIDKVARGLVK